MRNPYHAPPAVQYPAYGRRPNPYYAPPAMQYVAYGQRRNPSCADEDERCYRDLNKVHFGAVTDPNALHPVARAEWELQAREGLGARYHQNPVNKVTADEVRSRAREHKRDGVGYYPPSQWRKFGMELPANADEVYAKEYSSAKTYDKYENPAYTVRGGAEEFQCFVCGYPVYSGDRAYEDPKTGEIYCCSTCAKQRNPYFAPPAMQYVAYGRRRNPWYLYSEGAGYVPRDGDARLSSDISPAELARRKDAGEIYWQDAPSYEQVGGWSIGEREMDAAQLDWLGQQGLPPDPSSPDVSLVDLECEVCGGVLGCAPKCTWWASLPLARRREHLERLSMLRAWFVYPPLTEAQKTKMLKAPKKRAPPAANPKKRRRKLKHRPPSKKTLVDSMTPNAKAFLKAEIRRQVRKGKSQSQAVRIAYEVARQKRYKVPSALLRKKARKRK